MRVAMGWLVVGVLAAFLCGSPAQAAAKRVALLIGNQNYQSVGVLANPANDVKLMKAALEQAGFDQVTTVLDADVGGMRKALRSFEDAASLSEVAVVYYSGHGMEMNGVNYMIPTDAVLASDKDVEDETISLDRVQRSVEGASKLKLIILDACRNNPFMETMKRSISKRSLQKGLAKVEPESSNTLVAFASKAGTEALDGSGNNSPFATALAKFLIEPGLDIRIALGKVRDEVLKLTNAEQEPFVYGSLGGAEIVLNINVTVNVANTTTEGKPTREGGLSDAAADWQNIHDLADKDLLTAFLEKHGSDPVYRMLAEKKMKQLEEAEKSVSTGNDQIAWDALKGSTDLAALNRFIERYPDSPLRKEAEQQMAALQPKPETPVAGDATPATTTDAALADCYALAGEKQSMPLGPGIDFARIDGEKAVTACKAAASNHPDDALVMDFLGRAHDAAKNYPQALAAYQQAADKGNMYALANLGWLSVLGQGVPLDIAKGKGLIETAAKAGNPFAQVSLGQLYGGGYDGIPADDAEAFKWHSRAADQGSVDGFSYLGWAYGEGRGVEQNFDKAITYNRKAADLGDPDGMSALGYAYENGNGVAADIPEAIRWYEKAANAGDSYSMGALGALYDNGTGVTQDYAKALFWYSKGADAGSSFAMGALARLYDLGLGVKMDPKEAATWAIASLDSGEKDKLDDLKANPDDYSADMRKNLQMILKERGFYKGSASGKMDAATKAALDALFAARDTAAAATPEAPAEATKSLGGDDAATCADLVGEPSASPDFSGYDFEEIDVKQALAPCERAVSRSPEEAELANMLGRVQQAAGDMGAARKSYAAAAAKGDLNAVVNLAMLDLDGTGGKKDVAGAIARLEAAAKANGSFAQEALGSLYADGKGVKQDFAAALNWYKMASENGDLYAMSELASQYDAGQGTASDPKLAAKWAVEAIRRGNQGLLDTLKDEPDLFSSDTRTEMQTMLNKMGLYKGSADGKIGPATLAVLQKMLDNG